MTTTTLIRQKRKISKSNTKKVDVSRDDVQKDRDFEAWHASISKKGMYPLNSPGFSLPGPNFLRHAYELGDAESLIEKVQVQDSTKKSGKRTEMQIKQIGETLSDLYLQALRKPGFTLPIETRASRKTNVTFIPGHIWGQYSEDIVNLVDDPRMVDGPHPARVMVLGKMPWIEEDRALRNLIGASGEVLIRLLQQLRVKGTPHWYVTNLVKFMPPDGTTTLKSAWLKDCQPLLDQELRIVRPDYILCLGADASKAILGSKFGVGYMDGRVATHTFNTGVSHDDPRPHTAQVMTVIHPAQVAREQTLERQLYRGLARFNLLQGGARFDAAESDIDHRTVDNLRDLEELLYEVEHDPLKLDSVMAVDAEWHGEHPVNRGSYVRTIQFSWRVKFGAAIKICHAGGENAFVDDDNKPAIKRGLKLLSRFFKGGEHKCLDGRTVKFRPKRIVGHFFNSDLEWLVAMGLDLRQEFSVPLYDLDLKDPGCDPELKKIYRKLGYVRNVPAWVRTRVEGGADTGLMAHAIEESAQYGLEMLAMRCTTVPRYDVPLHDWREQYCKEQGIKASALEGYGMCPDEILIPYGIYDADTTLRLYYVLESMLDYDYEGNCCREAFWESMIAAPAVLEIHQSGILVDRERVDFLTEKFLAARVTQEKILKDWARWPDFNIRSVQHVKEFLFGEELNGKVTKSGEVIRIRPRKGEERKVDGEKWIAKSSGKSLRLQPLLDTSKPPKLWSDIVEANKEKDYSPSTNKMVLSILAQENEEAATQVNWIRDYRFLDQVLKTVLRPPKTDDEGNWLYEVDETDNSGLGFLAYDAGLASVICSDGKVRTHLYQTKETGRWASARPNLQNISKQRDPDYKRLLGATKNEKGKWVGGDYKYPLRSILRSSPGCLLIEADYTGAELFGMAIMSGDKTMIDHATRNQLPEEDPQYYDIHSNVAVLAFKLKCSPTKKGLDEIGRSSLRIIAKSVVFGIAYGRGAKAIALAAKEQGIKITVDQAQRVIDTIFEMYPGLVPFFNECKARATNERWLCHCFGRFRRFPNTDDYKLEGEFERQAMNFPIQGMIASAVSRAIAYLHDYKRQCGDPNLFRILLQIHDAILVEAPYENVQFVAEHVMPWAMREMVSIHPTKLDGVPTGDGPYKLGFEAEVMEHWGEHIQPEKLSLYGLDPQRKSYARDGVVVKYAG